MQIHLIMPVGAEPRFKEKQKLINKMFEGKKVDFHFPSYCQVNPFFDLNETLEQIRISDLIIVDLSYERPSCYYELVLAQAMGKEVILVAIDGTDIHQANGRDTVMYYKTQEDLVDYLSHKLDASLEKISEA